MNKRDEKDERRAHAGDFAGEWESCWHCHGAGHFDEADHDPVNYAPGEEIENCPECDGLGRYPV